MVNIRKLLIESVEVKLAVATDPRMIRLIAAAGHTLVRALKRGNKVLIAGNGGSAADAQHFAAELSGKFLKPDRAPLPAIALTTNTSNLTAIGNDFGYDVVFSRQLSAFAQLGDVFIGITTSGNSKNILEAFNVAHELGLVRIGLLGNGGGRSTELTDIALTIPSSNTQYIQEAHISLIHILCAIIDEAF